jgi:NAD+ diphosphatase
MKFISSSLPPAVLPDTAWWFIFKKDEILLSDSGKGPCIPLISGPEALQVDPVRTQYLGLLDDRPCYAAEIGAQEGVIEGVTFQPLRALFGTIPDDLFNVAFRAAMILHWDKTQQFCGQCGGKTRPSGTERAKVCGVCGATSYPRISPAIIVAVINDRSILLAHSNRFTHDFYSVLAGFVEPGETLEECVAREVKEEVGIDIRNIRYFGSQPWPFPDSLMIGFIADYAGGEITVDNHEVCEARWFTASNLPKIPGKISISRQLIDWFVENYSSL